jgi:2-polyprenyl-3-methyl-5-hydroxy-6-metoxy-1,4-benzoquinol methylase
MSLSKAEYDKSTFFYDEIMNSFKMDFSLYEDLIEILKPESILELGCGMGRLFPIFLKEAKIITGIDLSDEMLSKARQSYAKRNLDNIVVEFINDDMRSFRIDKKYDLIVIALSVLKHLSTNEERFYALKNARNHLNKDGFIFIDHTPFLYASTSTDWIDAVNSLVVDWVPDKSILKGYQWKKVIEGNKDILLWRYNNSKQTEFQVQFTTYRYDIEKLIEHIKKLNMSYEHILSEWGANGLGKKGKRFIGLVSYPGNTTSPQKTFRERIFERNDKLWSDHNLYLDDKNRKEKWKDAKHA